MIKIFVYAADQQLAEQTVQRLKDAGAESVALLESLKISARQPKENRYLFICETPTEKLSELATKTLQEDEYLHEVARWYELQTQVLHSCEKQNRRAILISNTQLVSHGNIQKLNQRWGLALNSVELKEEDLSSQKSADPVIGYLVQNLIRQTPPLKELAEAINHHANLVETTYSEAEAIGAYRKLIATNVTYKTEIRDAQAKLTHLGSLQEESELLLLQLQQEQEELERIYLEYKNYRETSEQEKTEITKVNTQLIERKKDQEEESVHLLMQLHQVQEELEHYFLNLKSTKSSLDASQDRLRRLLQNNPSLVDCDYIRSTPIDGVQNGFAWVIDGLESSDLSMQHAEFETFIEAGVLGIRFQKADSKNSKTLVRWPEVAKDFESVECIPAGKGPSKLQRAKILRELSTTDWMFINIFPQIIKSQHPDNKSIVDAANRLKQGLDSYPMIFRYDSIELKKNQVNADYEHIWLSFSKASYGDRSWPVFEMRLGASNLSSLNLFNNPKLEFPLIENVTTPFDSWFEESEDDYGKKLEIRFDLNQNVFDSIVWGRLAMADRNFIKQLLKQIPNALEEIGRKKTQVSRNIKDWIGLAVSCERMLNHDD